MARSEDRDREKRLKKMLKDLQKIDPGTILPYLTCFGNMDKEQIRCNRNNNGRMDAACEMFEQIVKKDSWYPILIEALREIGEERLANELEGPEKQSVSSQSSQTITSQESHQHVHTSQNSAHPKPTHPEPEASVTPGFTTKQVESGKEINKADGNDNTVKFPESPSLLLPVQEGRKETPLLRSQKRESGGSTGKPINTCDVHSDDGLPREGGPGSLPMPQRRPSQAGRESEEGEAPSRRGAPTSSDAKAIAVQRRDDSFSRREAAPERQSEDGVNCRGEQRRHVNVDNVEKVSNKILNLHINKSSTDDHIKLNNLSPTKEHRAFNWVGEKAGLEKVNNLDVRNVVDGAEDRCETEGTRSLSSRDIDPDDAHALSLVTDSEICEGISKDPTTSSNGGACLGEGDGVGVGVQGRGEVKGSEHGELAAGGGANEENRNSLILRMGSVVRGMVPGMLDSMSERMLHH